jgi:hypothetical protein
LAHALFSAEDLLSAKKPHRDKLALIAPPLR